MSCCVTETDGWRTSSTTQTVPQLAAVLAVFLPTPGKRQSEPEVRTEGKLEAMLPLKGRDGP